MTQEIEPRYISVKEAVFPFMKFPGVDTLLGPEMKSTGEVMGTDYDFGRAYAKAQRAAGMDLPGEGTVLVSVRDEDKPQVAQAVRLLVEEGFRVIATRGSAQDLRARGIPAETVNKVPEGSPHTVDWIRDRKVDLVISTTQGGDLKAVRDSSTMRRAALDHGVPYFTTAAGGEAAARAIRALRHGELRPLALQDLHAPR